MWMDLVDQRTNHPPWRSKLPSLLLTKAEPGLRSWRTSGWVWRAGLSVPNRSDLVTPRRMGVTVEPAMWPYDPGPYNKAIVTRRNAQARFHSFVWSVTRLSLHICSCLKTDFNLKLCFYLHVNCFYVVLALRQWSSKICISIYVDDYYICCVKGIQH